MAKDAAAAERPKPKKMGSAKVKGLFSKFVKTLSKKEKKAVPATATSTTPVVCADTTATTQVPAGEPKKQVVDVTEVPTTTTTTAALGRRVSVRLVPDDADRISIDSEPEEEERTQALSPTPQSRTPPPTAETTSQKPTSTPPSKIDVQPETVPLPESTVATPMPQEPKETKKHVETAPLPPKDLVEPAIAKDKPKKSVAFELPTPELPEEFPFQATTISSTEEKIPVETSEAGTSDITDAAPAVKDVTPKLVPVATLPDDPVPELVLEAETEIAEVPQDIEAKVEASSVPPFLVPAAAKVIPAEVVLAPAVAEATHAESGAAETALREPSHREEAAESPVEVEKHTVEGKKVDLAPIDTDSPVVEQSLPPTPQSLEAPKDKEPVLAALDDLVTEEETTFKILPVAEPEQEESTVHILPVEEEEQQYKNVEAALAKGTTFRVIASPPPEAQEETAFHILPVADEQPKDVSYEAPVEAPVEEPKDVPSEPEETFHILPAPSTPPTLPNLDLETWIQQQFPTHGMTPDGAFVGEKVFAQHLLELAEQQGGHRDLDRLRAVVGEIAEEEETKNLRAAPAVEAVVKPEVTHTHHPDCCTQHHLHALPVEPTPLPKEISTLTDYRTIDNALSTPLVRHYYSHAPTHAPTPADFKSTIPPTSIFPVTPTCTLLLTPSTNRKKSRKHLSTHTALTVLPRFHPITATSPGAFKALLVDLSHNCPLPGTADFVSALADVYGLRESLQDDLALLAAYTPDDTHLAGPVRRVFFAHAPAAEDETDELEYGWTPRHRSPTKLAHYLMEREVWDSAHMYAAHWVDDATIEVFVRDFAVQEVAARLEGWAPFRRVQGWSPAMPADGGSAKELMLRGLVEVVVRQCVLGEEKAEELGEFVAGLCEGMGMSAEWEEAVRRERECVSREMMEDDEWSQVGEGTERDMNAAMPPDSPWSTSSTLYATHEQESHLRW